MLTRNFADRLNPRCGEAFEASFDLLDFKQPTAVQHFGASIIYETIRNKWEDCIANERIATGIKGALIEKLTLGAHFQNQSVTNKLSSSLALFALYCLPDVWPEPVQDLTGLWAGQPELLLRVLAELAAEFHHVQMPLKQRNLVKSSLHRMDTVSLPSDFESDSSLVQLIDRSFPPFVHVRRDVMDVIELVLLSGDASPSLKNAAIECVEEWLRLPSMGLLQWQPILKIVLTNALNDL
uniref:Xpo1 domain-containing protein n=1 Tax=Ascaris lumbricoides TaxID=6252 RepID=A0A0M3ICK2_ASCLU